MQTTKIQYIKTKLQVETAKNLLSQTLATKRNEKAKLLFLEDVKKINKIIAKRKPIITNLVKKLEKEEKEFDKEISKVTKNKCEGYREIIDENTKEDIAKVAVRNSKYSRDEIEKIPEETDIDVYERAVNLDKQQEEIDAFILEMILGKVTADELTKLVTKISNIK